jgi:hypothetical protein
MGKRSRREAIAKRNSVKARLTGEASAITLERKSSLLGKIEIVEDIDDGDPDKQYAIWSLASAASTNVQHGPDYQRGVGTVRSAAEGPIAKRENYKIRDIKIRERAKEMRHSHPDWSVSNVATQLKKDTCNKSPETRDDVDDVIIKLSHRRLREIIRTK